MRWLGLLAFALVPGVAHGACRPVPLPETPQALLKAFSERMARAGTGDWRFATNTANGTMYYSKATDLNFVIDSSDGLVSETGLFLSKQKPSDASRFEAASTFLGAHISGSTEASLQERVGRAIADAIRDRKVHTVREGETLLVFSTGDPEATIVKVGRAKCD